MSNITDRAWAIAFSTVAAREPSLFHVSARWASVNYRKEGRMRPFREVAELSTGQPDKFAVLSIDPTKKEGRGCIATVLSLHRSREDADRAKQEA
jgi:hypothetical protein